MCCVRGCEGRNGVRCVFVVIGLMLGLLFLCGMVNVLCRFRCEMFLLRLLNCVYLSSVFRLVLLM